MSAVRNKDTQPEMLLRRELHRRGLRYRLHHRMLPGHPDLVFAAARVAVFVDGDFWHGGGWAERGFESFEAQFSGLRDPERWRSKIERNVTRDAHVNEQLSVLGWTVIRLLESEIRAGVDAAANRVELLLRLAVLRAVDSGTRCRTPAKGTLKE